MLNLIYDAFIKTAFWFFFFADRCSIQLHENHAINVTAIFKTTKKC